MKLSYVTVESTDGPIEHVVIDFGEGNFSTMPRSMYEERQAREARTNAARAEARRQNESKQ